MTEFLSFLQSFSTPLLDSIFLFISSLTGELVYVAVVCFVYWCVSKNKGIITAITLVLSFGVNSGLKHLFKVPRPYTYSDVRQIDVETGHGYSFPSGHAQLSTTFAGLGIINIKRTAVYIAAILLVILTGLSRMYLGVHTPVDIICGYAVGTVMIFIAKVLFKHEDKKKLVAFSMLAVTYVLLVLTNDADLAAVTFLYTGCVAGFLIEEKFIGFEPYGTKRQKAVQYIIGMVSVVIVKLATEFLPEAAGYICLGLTITLIVPAILKFMKK